MPAEIETVGILAGEGALPLQLYNHCIDNNIPVVVVMFQGCAYANWSHAPHHKLETGIEKVGAIFDFFNKHDVDTVVMIGNLSRPSLKTLRPDWRGLKTLGKIAGAFMQGDDNLLRSLREVIEKEGFKVRGVDYYLTDLKPAAGILTQTTPNDAQTTLIHKGINASILHGLADKGQSVLVHPDGSYSYETEDGTTALIERDGQQGSILAKTIKPQQDPDLDRPTVGLNTIIALHRKGCAGMAVQADAVLMVDKKAMVDYADQNGLFITAETVGD